MPSTHYRGYRLWWVTNGVLIRDHKGNYVDTVASMTEAYNTIDGWLTAP